MKKYYHVKKSDINYTIRQITAAQMKTGFFYNVTVLPCRSKYYNPDKYATIRVG